MEKNISFSGRISFETKRKLEEEARGRYSLDDRRKSDNKVKTWQDLVKEILEDAVSKF